MDFPKNSHLKHKNVALITQKLHPEKGIPASTTLPIKKGRIRIQQYQYDEENILGHGYTSRVYLGHSCLDLRSQFAIKVVDKRRISQIKEDLQLLKQEIEIHQLLDHPNIVKCFKVIEKGHFYYFILEYCPNGTLETFIKKHKKLAQSTAVSIMEQVLSGYRYLLGLKVLHRDIKPPNILRVGNCWKICDFGFSVIGKKCLVGTINVGTPSYMAPQSLERSFYSAKTDFFALGVLCYQMVFGSPPWQHKNEKILLQLMTQKKLNMEQFEDLTNQNITIFITKCCDPVQRRRINIQQFENFTFWKDWEQPSSRAIKNVDTRHSSKSFSHLKEENCQTSTCPSQTSVSATKSKCKQESIEAAFNKNNAILSRQLYNCQILYSLMLNCRYLLFQQSEEKELFVTILGKHAAYIIRRMRHQKTNYLNLRRWEQYLGSQDFDIFLQKILKIAVKIQECFKKQVQRKSIITIRAMNKRFDDLIYDKNLSAKCIGNLKEYLLTLLPNLAQKYKANGQQFTRENGWPSQTLDSLLIYFKYVKTLSLESEESRTIAVREQSDRKDILYDFRLSKMGFEDFTFLTQEVSELEV